MNIIQYLGKGVYHEDNNMPCQDRVRHCYAKSNDNIIMAVSDGCSSAKYAEIAAQINVDTVIELFSATSLSDFLKNQNDASVIIDAVINNFKKKYGKIYDADPSDFSATLLFVVRDNQHVLVGHIGDGNVLCTQANGETVIYSKEENAGASNRTYFTVSPDAAAHLFLTAAPSSAVENIIMYSDGPQKMLWYKGEKNIENAAKNIITLVRAGKITNCTSLAKALEQMTAESMFQLMDDWSMLIFDASQPQCDDMYLDPISMKKHFLDNFTANKA